MPERSGSFCRWILPPLKKKGGGGKQLWKYGEEKEDETSIRYQKGEAASVKEISQELMLFPARAVPSRTRGLMERVAVNCPDVIREGDVTTRVWEVSPESPVRNRGEAAADNSNAGSALTREAGPEVGTAMTELRQGGLGGTGAPGPMGGGGGQEVPGEAVRGHRSLTVRSGSCLCAANTTRVSSCAWAIYFCKTGDRGHAVLYAQSSAGWGFHTVT